ncbi:translocation/assembly module TamB domain-containing protein [Hyphomonas sp. FCG-A18]|uniref:translocation/assembly module TamB domain-containing protein n=1 Tax=Hyphomonas sp. FCG-A18 TaxID=3080019 RepID=UPI002B2EC2F1|nr:translocation/assembly module TamB domain-containing protein [Hyphomonas sp. FCG-A18]
MQVSLPSARTFRRIAFGVFLSVLALIVLLRILAATPIGRGLVESRLEAMSIRGQTIDVTGLKGDILGRMSIQHLSIRDHDGVWTKATDIELSWTPLSLLSGHFQAKDIGISQLTVARRPHLAPSAPSTSSGNSFLNRYTVQSLSLDEIEVSETLTGFPQAYALSAAMDTRRESGHLTFDLMPLGDYGDTANIKLIWGKAKPLQGFVRLSAPASGLAASLLQTPAGQNLLLTIEASGAVSDWQLIVAGSVGNQTALDLTSRRQDGTYTAKGYVSFEALGLLEPLAARLGPRLSFEGALNRERNLSASVSADTVNMRVAGDLNTSKNNYSLENFTLSLSDIDAARLTGTPTLVLPDLHANGRLEHSETQQAFTGTLTAPELRYQEYAAFDLSSVGTHAFNRHTITLATQVSTRALDGLPDSTQFVLKGPLSAHLEAAFNLHKHEADISHLELRNAALGVSAKGELSMAGPVSLSGELSVSDGLPIGPVNATWSVGGNALSTAQLDVNALIELASQPQTIRELVGEKAQLGLSLAHEQEALIVKSLNLKSDRISGRARGLLRHGNIILSGQLTSAPLQVETLETGQISSAFEISGPVAAPQIEITANTPEISLSGETLHALSLNAGLSLAKTPTFSLEADADYAQAPLQITAEGRYAKALVEVTTFNAAWTDFEASGQGSLNPSDPNLSDLTLLITGTSPFVGKIDGQLLYANQALKTDLSIQSARHGALELERAHLDMNGVWPQFEASLQYEGQATLLDQEHAISGHHDLQLNAETRLARIEGSLMLAEEVLNLSRPIEIALADGLTAQGQLSAFDGLADFSLNVSGQERSHLSISDVSMVKLGYFIRRPALFGRLDGSAEIILTDQTVNGQVAATIANLAHGTSESPTIDIDLSAQITDNQLTAELHSRNTDRTLDLIARLTTDLQTAGTLPSMRLAEDALIPISISGGGPVSSLWALAAPPELRLEGNLDMRVSNGAGENLRFAGPIALKEGTFEDGLTGLHLQNIGIDAFLSHQGIEVQNAFANGARNGTLEASGLYSFDGSGSVTLKASQLSPLRRSDISATVSGSAFVKRRARRTHIEGQFDIDRARIDLSQLQNGGYTTLDVVFEDDLNGQNGEPVRREAVSLDLGVSANRGIFVTRPGIESEWGLDVKVTGPLGDPQLVGRATMIRGEANLLNRQFRFSEGLVRFVGDPADTQLLIQADRTEDGMTTSISLSGDLTDPEISLGADPPMPDDEILARVLFGRSPSELSPLEAAQLAGGAAQLAGGNGLDLTGQLQAATGLDRLNFGLNDEGAATLSTGKYLAEDIYLEVESGSSGAPAVALEWTPLENVAVDAEIDPELGPKFSIQWKRDFDRLPGQAQDKAEQSAE